MSNANPRWGTRVATAAIAAGLAFAPATASAEGPVSVTGKGMVGGGLLGAEVVMIGMAIGGVKPWWPYLVFGAAGAGAGIAGGWAVESETDETGPAEPALYMLAGGMALVVPALVAMLNATAYEPEEDIDDSEDDDLPGEAPGIDVDVNAGVQTGLIDVNTFDQPRVRMMVPSAAMRPIYTSAEIVQYGVEQQTQLHVPVISGTF